MKQTFYDLLGVSPDATTEEIEAAYRDAIKEAHPDVSDDVDASHRAARLNKAKDVLTDENERARYDRLGHESYVSGAGASGPASTGRATGGSPESGSAGRRRGEASDADSRPGSGGSDRYRGAGGPNAGGSVGETVGDSGRETTGRRSRDTRWSSGSGGDATGSPSARRQAAASASPGPNIDDSWNAWDRTRAWAVRQETGDETGLHPSRFFPPDQSLFLLVSTFFLYPVFVFSAVFPAFPLLARLIVAACTLLVVVYLLSMPEVAVLVFGLWSFLFPFALVLFPGAGLLSLVGLVGVVSTWVPLGFAVFTHAMLRPG